MGTILVVGKQQLISAASWGASCPRNLSIIDSAFTVTQFKNRNGTLSWRVSGWLNGIRIRKNFLTREEAAAEKGPLEIKAAQTAGGMRLLATSMTEKQAREAEAAFQRLADRPRSLTFYLDYALSQYHEPQQAKKVADAIAEYVASEQQLRSAPQCSHGCSLRPKPTFCGCPFSDEGSSGRRSVQGWKGEGTNGLQHGRDFCRGEGIAPDEGRPLAGFERGELDGQAGWRFRRQ